MQHGKVIAYASMQLKDYKLRYPTYDLEISCYTCMVRSLRYYRLSEFKILAYLKRVKYDE